MNAAARYEAARHGLASWIRHLEDGRTVADATALAAMDEQDALLAGAS